jgi:hypothetical protein
MRSSVALIARVDDVVTGVVKGNYGTRVEVEHEPDDSPELIAESALELAANVSDWNSY